MLFLLFSDDRGVDTNNSHAIQPSPPNNFFAIYLTRTGPNMRHRLCIMYKIFLTFHKCN